MPMIIKKSATGAKAGMMNWNSNMLGNAAQPSALYFLLNSTSRCFHNVCITPKVQRKRCLMNIFTVSGASVNARASCSLAMVYPLFNMRIDKSQSSARVSVVKPPAAVMASLRKAPMAPDTTVMALSQAKALRSKFWLVMYSIDCQRVSRFTGLCYIIYGVHPMALKRKYP